MPKRKNAWIALLAFATVSSVALVVVVLVHRSKNLTEYIDRYGVPDFVVAEGQILERMSEDTSFFGSPIAVLRGVRSWDSSDIGIPCVLVYASSSTVSVYAEQIISGEFRASSEQGAFFALGSRSEIRLVRIDAAGQVFEVRSGSVAFVELSRPK